MCNACLHIHATLAWIFLKPRLRVESWKAVQWKMEWMY